MLRSRTDPKSCITEYTLVYEDNEDHLRVHGYRVEGKQLQG